MQLVETRTRSGLIVAEQSQDFETVARMLRDYRRDLRLVPTGIDRHGKTVYQVFADRGGDRPAVPVFHGMTADLSEALPLSSRFVDEVRKLDLNTRGAPEDPEAANTRLRERHARESRETLLEIARENERLSRRSPVLPRGQSLRRGRDKDRAQGRRI